MKTEMSIRYWKEEDDYWVQTYGVNPEWTQLYIDNLE